MTSRRRYADAVQMRNAVRLQTHSRGIPVAVLLSALVGAALRLPGLLSEVWLDEIWSVQVAREATSAADFLLKVRTDNNHVLNSLWLYVVSGTSDGRLLRLLSFAASVAAVALAAVAGARFGRRAGVLAGALVALSFPLAALTTEARGYGLEHAFALGAFLALARHLDAPTPWSAAAFGVSAALGLLAHLSFVHVLAAAFAWSAWRIIRAPRPRGERLAAFAGLWAFPAAFAAGLWWVFARHLVEGGGPLFTPLATAAETAALTLGLPDAWTSLALLSAAAVLAAGCLRLRRDGDDAWIFFLVVVLVSPAIVVGAMRYTILRPRHISLSILFLLVLLARVAAALVERGGAARAAAAAGLLVFAGGNLWRTGAFAREGRGHYREALREMTRKSPGPLVTVGGDNDFRTGLTVAFHAATLPPGVRIAYVTRESWPPAGPDWVIVHDTAPDARAEDSIEPAGIRYVLDREWRFYGPSGLCWFVYRKPEAPARGPGIP